MTHGAAAPARQDADFAGRPRLSLDGAWRFRFESGDWRTANVPNPWAAEFADLRERSGTATYERAFELPAAFAGREAVLRFGAVNYAATVALNGTEIGGHEGGYLPFEIVLPGHLLAARNTLTVTVVQPGADHPDFPFAEVPHGKQSWYGQLGGIWQSVGIEARDRRHVREVRPLADHDTGEVRVGIATTPAAASARARVEVLDPAGRPVAEAGTVLGADGATIALKVPDRRAWSPDDPVLYRAVVTLLADGEEVDTAEKSFGFRKIEARAGRLYLNDAPLYIRGALDQDYYPDGISVPPSTAFLEDQFEKAKALGLNLLRCHIKVPDPRYYEVADRLGMLVWTEIPNVARFSDAAARRMRETMEGILERDGHHPSIIAWTLINEDWGTRLTENAGHRAWLKAEYDWLKQADPTRLVVDNSPCHPNYHVKTDLNDYHWYRSVPERREEWDALTAEFAAGADWTFSPHGDAERRGDEPLIVSEFGVWGLPDPAPLRNADGSEPFWFESGPGWGDGAAYPHGIENRFAVYQLDTVFGTFSDFIAAVQDYQFANLKYQIESIRAQATIMGYVITELTDVHWEANGLLDLDRNPRRFAADFPSIAGDLVVVPQTDDHAGTAGADHEIAVRIATGGQAVPAGASLVVTLDGSPVETRPVPQVPSLASEALDPVHIRLPDLNEARRVTVGFELVANGATLAANRLALSVYPARGDAPALRLAARDARIGAHLAALGYTLTEADDADVVVVHALDAADVEALNAGARYLVLADGTAETHGGLRLDPPGREQPFVPVIDEVPGLPRGPESQLPNIGLHRRDGTMWRGDWIANFSWLRRAGAFARLPGGPLLDLSFSKVVPRHVMTGFRPWEYGGPVHGGLTVGWLHKPAVTIAERRVGRGGLVASTFRLLTGVPGADPVASALIDALVETAAEA